MKARFSSMVRSASSMAARRMYGDFGAPWPLVVVVVVSDIDFLTKHPSVICRKISGVGWIGRGGRTAGEQPESEAVQVTLLHGSYQAICMAAMASLAWFLSGWKSTNRPARGAPVGVFSMTWM